MKICLALNSYKIIRYEWREPASEKEAGSFFSGKGKIYAFVQVHLTTAAVRLKHTAWRKFFRRWDRKISFFEEERVNRRKLENIDRLYQKNKKIKRISLAEQKEPLYNEPEYRKAKRNEI